MADTAGNVKLTVDDWPTQPAATYKPPAARSRTVIDANIAAFMAALDRGYGDGGGWLR